MKRRMLSIVLVLTMLLSMAVLPANVFAVGEESDSEPAVGMQLLKQMQIVHFYDWDGTYLGETLFWIIGGNAMAAYAVEEFTQKKYAGEYTVDNSTHEDRYVDDASKPLTYKDGYNFGGWVEVSEETVNSIPTSYATEEEIDANIKDFEHDSLDYSQNVTHLKAAYIANEALNTWFSEAVILASSYYYSFSDFSYTKPNNVNYDIHFTVKRKNADGRGVTRLRKPTLCIRSIVGEKQVDSKYDLKGLDEEQVTLSVPRYSTEVHFSVVDAYTTDYSKSNTNSTVIELNAQEPCYQDEIRQHGYEIESNLWDFNNKLIIAIDKLEEGVRYTTWEPLINIYMTMQMALGDEINAQNIGEQEPTTVLLTSIARNKIMLYSVANGKRKLTYEEIQEAIQMDTGNHLRGLTSKEINTQFVPYMQPKVEAVYQESQANYGGVMTAQELEAYINANF